MKWILKYVFNWLKLMKKRIIAHQLKTDNYSSQKTITSFHGFNALFSSHFSVKKQWTLLLPVWFRIDCCYFSKSKNSRNKIDVKRFQFSMQIGMRNVFVMWMKWFYREFYFSCFRLSLYLDHAETFHTSKHV